MKKMPMPPKKTDPAKMISKKFKIPLNTAKAILAVVSASRRPQGPPRPPGPPRPMMRPPGPPQRPPMPPQGMQRPPMRPPGM